MSTTKVTDSVRDTTAIDGTKINAVDAAKITTGTIPEARITTLDATKLTGNIANARIPASAVTQHVTAFDPATLEMNIAMLAFKVASANQLAKFSMVDQVIDEYQDATGIDAGASTNELAQGSGTAKYYEGGTGGAVTASGGTITTDGDYTVHKFTSSGNFVTDTTQTIEYLLVAGGGAGGGHDGTGAGGGGGAGGYLAATGVSLSAATYAIVIGAGGVGATTGVGPSGGNSTFNSLTTIGGGGGGHYNGVAPTSGGSGGGAGGNQGGTTNGAAGTSGQGYAGGNTAHYSSGGGGGGAGGVGQTTSANGNAGDGGIGLANDITGTSLFYAGGGGGAGINPDQGVGGSGVGSTAWSSTGTTGTAATANTGSGGGGTMNASPAAYSGAAGVAIIRRPTNNFTLGGNLTLQSVATTAESAPTTADLVVLIEDGAGTATINTDIKAKVSRDGSAFSDYVTFVDEGDWGTNKRILVARNIDISGIATGTAMKYKIETLNQSAGSKATRIHATSLAWA